ncbi:MAG: ribonuclease [Lachnospiraceae bacterium]|nr:ribonuclease [Lachnospiraceae bacterium]
MSRWVFTLLAAVLVLTGLVGCSSQDVETALDVAIGVLEVAEALEKESEIENDVTPSVTELSSESQSPTEEIETEIETEADKEEPVIDEDGHYTSKEEVALYIHTYGKLPSNFISKNEAEELGWKKKQGEAGQLHVVAPGMSIGGSRFGNYEGLLPEAKGRKYYECDINYVKGNRGAERIVYSNDGLIFYTGDHYESFEQLYPVE